MAVDEPGVRPIRAESPKVSDRHEGHIQASLLTPSLGTSDAQHRSAVTSLVRPGEEGSGVLGSSTDEPGVADRIFCRSAIRLGRHGQEVVCEQVGSLTWHAGCVCRLELTLNRGTNSGLGEGDLKAVFIDSKGELDSYS